MDLNAFEMFGEGRQRF